MAFSDGPLTGLLRRALEDQGPEGAVALNLLRKRLVGRSGSLIFMSDEDATNDPLLFVVRGKQQIIDEQRATIERMAEEIKLMGRHAANVSKIADRYSG